MTPEFGGSTLIIEHPVFCTHAFSSAGYVRPPIVFTTGHGAGRALDKNVVSSCSGRGGPKRPKMCVCVCRGEGGGEKNDLGGGEIEN